jgi:AmpD protein
MPRRDDSPAGGGGGSGAARGGGWSVDLATGLLRGVRFVASPHQNERPEGAGIELVVIHGISLPPDEFGGPWIEELFLGRLDPAAHPSFADLEGLRVSAHLLVRRSGTVVQYVPFHRRAWHSGVSSWRGREGCNDFAVGIEVEGSAAWPYLGAQYRALAGVLRALAAAYPAVKVPERVVGHADVAPDRKDDPWATFDWGRLHELTSGRGPG